MNVTLVLLLLAQVPVDGPPPPPPVVEEVEQAALSTDERVQALEDRLAEVETKLKAAEAKTAAVTTRVGWLEKLSVKFSGYFDLGFFWVQGDGSGTRPDYWRDVTWANDLLRSWVLVGDPLSTTINSRGDVADTGASRSILYNPIHASNKPGFLLNAFNVDLRATYDDDWRVELMVDFLPRDRDVSKPGVGLGDFIDVKLAYAQWQHVFAAVKLTISAGKFDSLLGVEYRLQEANNRVGVTPSLICRYTCGRPVGLKASAELFDEQLEVVLALTNGSHQVEGFPFANEIDSNFGKTVAGRVAVRLPFARSFELDASGAIGPQDHQTDDSVVQWHWGVAAKFAWQQLTASVEFVKGRASGKTDFNGGAIPCGAASCLDYRGGYVLVAYRVHELFKPYARFDWRTAALRKGMEYAYQSDDVRVTLGARVDVTPAIAVKAEYVFNHELFPYDFPDDVFTSSLVVTY
jgi:hypothetical protein